jgi:hypothetical protein
MYRKHRFPSCILAPIIIAATLTGCGDISRPANKAEIDSAKAMDRMATAMKDMAAAMEDIAASLRDSTKPK